MWMTSWELMFKGCSFCNQIFLFNSWSVVCIHMHKYWWPVCLQSQRYLSHLKKCVMHVFAVYGNFLFPFGLVTHGMITQFQVAQRICNQMLHTLLPFICVVCITDS